MVFDSTKQFKLKGNTPKNTKLRADLKILVNNGSSGEDILNIEAKMKELEEEDLAKALKLRKNFSILEDERPSESFTAILDD